MEVVVAIGLITAFLVGAISLVSFSISSIRIQKSRIIAAGLAQEGLEIVRSIRDNNWLSGKREAANWRDGLAPGQYRVQYDKITLLNLSSDKLRMDSEGFYYYEDQGYRPNSVATPFIRIYSWR